jgi:hypothetical protein
MKKIKKIKLLKMNQEILYSDFTSSEKILLSIIQNCGREGCKYSNEYLSNILGFEKKTSVATIISNFKKINILKIKGGGKKRKIYYRN